MRSVQQMKSFWFLARVGFTFLAGNVILGVRFQFRAGF